mgnify:CR=1 FL=1
MQDQERAHQSPLIDLSGLTLNHLQKLDDGQGDSPFFAELREALALTSSVVSSAGFDSVMEPEHPHTAS